MRVLLVEDDSSVAKSIELMLHSEGFIVDSTDLGEDGLEIGKLYDYDIIILDLMLPDIDGYEVLRRLRSARVTTPILILSGLSELDHKIKGLGVGADDYLTKPFDLGELVARLHALLRRTSLSDQSSDTMTVGPLTIDTARRLVFVDGERVDLTKREFDLLAVLAENAGVVLSRQRLLELVWGYDFDVDTNVADVFISYLRRKLERDGLPRVIHTVRGIGYVLRDEQ